MAGAHQSDLIASDIVEYLAQQERKDMLRLLTCGSVDDGKSTLIGRLLHDSHLLYEDQLASVTKDSATVGHAGDEVDLALLMDGLRAEREQGITIDVAYRFFSTSRRSFIIADTPGHEQYTRNMVTGASTCDLAIILMDASKGVLAQTRRHSAVAALLGIRHVVVAINKMDLVDWSEDRFEQLVADYHVIAARIGIDSPTFLPLSALRGDNVVDRSAAMPWYQGPTLMEHIETVPLDAPGHAGDLRFPVQLVIRPDHTFRGFAGTLASGRLAPGDAIEVLPSGRRSTVARLSTFDGDVSEAGPGDAVTVVLEDEIDVSRGDLLVAPGSTVRRGHELTATVVWLSEQPLQSSRDYLLLHCHGLTNARVAGIDHRLDVDTLDEVPADVLELNDIARCEVHVDRALTFDPYEDSRSTGSFILIDRLTNATVAAGMAIDVRGGWDATPSARLTGRSSEIDLEEREARYGQRGCTVFLTGLTSAGKSTVARGLERRLFDQGQSTIRLDGENLRLGISRDLGFSAQERSENLRRAAEVARLVNDQGLVAIAALVAPKARVRERARDLIGADRFVEVFVDTPLEVCRARDASGIYEAADRGEIPQFPGVSATYDRPTDADLVIDTVTHDVDACVDQIIALLTERGFLGFVGRSIVS